MVAGGVSVWYSFHKDLKEGHPHLWVPSLSQLVGPMLVWSVKHQGKGAFLKGESWKGEPFIYLP